MPGTVSDPTEGNRELSGNGATLNGCYRVKLPFGRCRNQLLDSSRYFSVWLTPDLHGRPANGNYAAYVAVPMFLDCFVGEIAVVLGAVLRVVVDDRRDE